MPRRWNHAILARACAPPFIGPSFDRSSRERKAGVMEPGTRAWVADILLGGIIGGVTGAIVAVNFVIFSGIDDGYEASIPAVFRQNVLIGFVTVAVLLAGPVLGIVMARRQRRKRLRPDPAP